MPISLPLEDTYSAVATVCDTGQARLVTDVEGSRVAYERGRLKLYPLATAGYSRLAMAYGDFADMAGRTFMAKWDSWQSHSADRFSVGFHPFQAGDPHQSGAALLYYANGGAGTSVGLNDVPLANESNTLISGIDPVGLVALGVMSGDSFIGPLLLLSGPTNARGLAAYPNARPLARSPIPSSASNYLVLNSRLGDVEVDHVKLRDVAAWANWYACAHAADKLTGSGGLVSAEVGGAYTLSGSGTLTKTSTGVQNDGQVARAVLNPGAPSGLVSALARLGANPQYFTIFFRYQDANNYWRLTIRWDWYADLAKVVGGIETQVASGPPNAGANANHLIQILDDGQNIRCFWNGDTRFTASDAALASATGVGFQIELDGTTGHTKLSHFEAHPRSVSIPSELRPASGPFEAKEPDLRAESLFGLANGTDLNGTLTDTGGQTWVKRTGPTDLVGDGAGNVWPATNPSNLVLYTHPWDQPSRVTARLKVIPPGTAYGQGHEARAGVWLVEDPNPTTLTGIQARAFISESQTNAAEIEVQVYLNGSTSGSLITPVQLGDRISHGNEAEIWLSYDGSMGLLSLWLGTVPVKTFSWQSISGRSNNLVVNHVGVGIDTPDTRSKLNSLSVYGTNATPHDLTLAQAVAAGQAPAVAATQTHAPIAVAAVAAGQAPAIAIEQAHAPSLVSAVAPAEAAHVGVTQAHTLALETATAQAQIPSVGLSQAHTLIPQAAASAAQAPSVALSSGVNLTLSAAVAEAQAPSVLIAQTHGLALQNTTAPAQAPSVAISGPTSLTLTPAVGAAVAPAVALAQEHRLSFAPAISASLALSVLVGTAHYLTLSGLVVAAVAPAVILSRLPDIERATLVDLSRRRLKRLG